MCKPYILQCKNKNFSINTHMYETETISLTKCDSYEVFQCIDEASSNQRCNSRLASSFRSHAQSRSFGSQRGAASCPWPLPGEGWSPCASFPARCSGLCDVLCRLRCRVRAWNGWELESGSGYDCFQKGHPLWLLLVKFSVFLWHDSRLSPLHVHVFPWPHCESQQFLPRRYLSSYSMEHSS